MNQKYSTVMTKGHASLQESKNPIQHDARQRRHDPAQIVLKEDNNNNMTTTFWSSLLLRQITNYSNVILDIL